MSSKSARGPARAERSPNHPFKEDALTQLQDSMTTIARGSRR